MSFKLVEPVLEWYRTQKWALPEKKYSVPPGNNVSKEFLPGLRICFNWPGLIISGSKLKHFMILVVMVTLFKYFLQYFVETLQELDKMLSWWKRLTEFVFAIIMTSKILEGLTRWQYTYQITFFSLHSWLDFSQVKSHYKLIIFSNMKGMLGIQCFALEFTKLRLLPYFFLW